MRAAFLLFLMSAPSTHAATPEERLAPCFACHGENGQSPNPKVPSLGAQPSPYTLIQLFMFRERLRVAEPMNDAMKGVGDEDLQSLADAIARLPAPKPPADAGDTGRIARGRDLVRQNHCDVCHRPDFSGQENVARLADQREDYLLKTLQDYKSGARHAYDSSMAEVLQPIDDTQFGDLAHYLAHAR
jgi:cytochrome c553